VGIYPGVHYLPTMVYPGCTGVYTSLYTTQGMYRGVYLPIYHPIYTLGTLIRCWSPYYTPGVLRSWDGERVLGSKPRLIREKEPLREERPLFL